MNGPGESGVRVQVFASGRVQGVGYRYFVFEEARALGLCGWVRNLYDGRVEAEIVGDPQTVNRLLDVMKNGPRLAHVSGLEIIPLAYENRYTEFTVRNSV